MEQLEIVGHELILAMRNIDGCQFKVVEMKLMQQPLE